LNDRFLFQRPSLGKNIKFAIIAFYTLKASYLTDLGVFSEQYYESLAIFSAIIVAISLVLIQLASAALPDVHFSAVGDFQCATPAKNTVSNIQSMNPSVVLGLGDYSYETTETCWLNIIQPIKSITKVAIGNHEVDESQKYSKIVSEFGLTNPYYSFNKDYVHVLVMDTDKTSFSSGSAQFNFVKSDLQAASQNPNIKWIIVTLHKPLYSSPNSCSTSGCNGLASVRDIYHPLFDQYGVDLVLEGHTHSYQRTYPLKFNSADKSKPIQTSTNKNTYNNPEGQIYAIVGTGGASFHSLSSKAYFTAVQNTVAGRYGILDIVISNDGNNLEGKFYENDGPVTDTFTISKSNSAPMANNQAVSVTKNTAKPITLTASDIDGNNLAYTVLTQPSHGSLTGTTPSLTYTPSSGYTGSDSFTFKVNDGQIDSNTATVSISVSDAPAGGYHYDPSFVATGSNYHEVPSSSSLQIPKFTVAAWFKTSKTYTTEGMILTKGGIGTDTSRQNMNYGLWITSAQKIVGGFETSSGTDKFVTSPSTYNNGQWHFGAVTYDGTSVKLYVDGAQVGTLSTTSSPETSGTLPVRIGANSLAVNKFFTGNLDEARVWNRALSSQEIIDAFNGNINNAGQVLYVPFGSANSPPIANNQTVSTPKNTAKAITLTASDPENNPLTYTIVSNPLHGTLTGTAPSVTYTPAADYTGPDNFTFKARDGNLDSNIATISISVTPPSDATPPTVVSTNPVSGATGVSASTTVVATFSEAVQSSTVTTTAFNLKSGTSNIAGTVSLSQDGKTATFSPTSSLIASTSYSATITTAVKDIAGNSMTSDKVWSFTTAATVDTTPPTVASTTPNSGATGVSVNSFVSATFSEPVQSSTATSSFTVKTGSTNIHGAVSLSGDGKTATFTPSNPLAASTSYTATITTGVKDIAGNSMAANKVWSFTTAAAADTTSPTVVSTNPASGATGIPISSSVAATFSESVQPTTVSSATFTLKAGTTSVSGGVTLSGDGKTATLTPSSQLADSTSYTATVTTGVKDLAGNAMSANKAWSFMTEAASASLCDTNLPISGATSSPTQTGYLASNAIDNNANTRWWSTFSVNPWIKADLGAAKSICSVDIAWADGNQRQYTFTISVSSDDNSYSTVFSGKSSGTTTAAQKYSFAETPARYVKITITQSHVGSSNSIAQISEIDVFGKASTLSQFSASSRAPSESPETDSIPNVTNEQSDTSLPSNKPPVAIDDSLTTSVNKPLAVAVLTNDVDPDSDKIKLLSAESLTSKGGTVNVKSNNEVMYYPPRDFTGKDSFSYTIIDKDGMTDIGRVVATVEDTSSQKPLDKMPLAAENTTKENTDAIPMTPSLNKPDSTDQNIDLRANAGRDKIVREGTLFTLDASKSQDVDGRIVSYEWKQTSGPSVLLEHSNLAKISLNAPSVDQDNSIEFQLTVTDDLGQFNSDVVVVKVLDVTDWLKSSDEESNDKLTAFNYNLNISNIHLNKLPYVSWGQNFAPYLFNAKS
jgi:hypothetical protein